MRAPIVVPAELKEPTLLEKVRYRHEARIVDGVVTPSDVSGLLGFRQWHINPGLYLTSLVYRRKYDSSVIWADRIPTRNNRSGIYALRIPLFQAIVPHLNDTATGLVELSGHVVLHEDGTLRGERCRILLLFAYHEFAERLSRVYGVPVMSGSHPDAPEWYLKRWLCTHEGVKMLKHNVDLISDMQARRLLGQVEGLNQGTAQSRLGEQIPEHLKDTGEPLPVLAGPPPRSSCSNFMLIVRNGALEGKFPKGWTAFARKYDCRFNDRISVRQSLWLRGLDRPLREILVSGLTEEDDYILIEPNYLRWGPESWYRIGQRSTGEFILCTDWLQGEVDWLNSNVDGKYRWLA